MRNPTPNSLAQMIDHTLLKPDAKESQIVQLCHEAIQYGFKGVCVNARALPKVIHELRGTLILPIAVVGFPLGAVSTQTKVFETQEAVALGAQEVDMVIAIGELKDRKLDAVSKDIRATVEAARGNAVKVILETCLLSDEEKAIGAKIARDAGAVFVKTSTGFSSSGARVEDLRLLRETLGPDFPIKASGGIRTLTDAMAMIEAGASRLGTSQSVAILQELREDA